jgi:flagellar protein FliS
MNMNTAMQYQKYREQSIRALTPGEQIVFLFRQAAISIVKAMKCIDEKDICGAHNAIVKAQDIYAYLSDSLNMNYEISKDLFALYDFIYDRLAQANFKKDKAILSHALAMTRNLCETWEQAERKSRQAH